MIALLVGAVITAVLAGLRPTTPARILGVADAAHPVTQRRPARPAETDPTGRSGTASPGRVRVAGLPSTIGQRVVRLVRGRAASTDRTTWIDNAIGLSVLAAPLAVLAGPLAAGLVVAGGVTCTRLVEIRAARQTVDETGRIGDALPDVVDLLSLAVGAGLALPAALDAITAHAPERVRPDLDEIQRQRAAGVPLAAAVDILHDRWGEDGRPLVHALVDHLRDGTALLPSLDRVGDQLRRHRQRASETRARRLPVLLLFPLVLCVLPAFALLTVAPLLSSTLDSLSESPLGADAPCSTRESEYPPCP